MPTAALPSRAPPTKYAPWGQNRNPRQQLKLIATNVDITVEEPGAGGEADEDQPPVVALPAAAPATEKEVRFGGSPISFVELRCLDVGGLVGTVDWKEEVCSSRARFHLRLNSTLPRPIDRSLRRACEGLRFVPLLGAFLPRLVVIC